METKQYKRKKSKGGKILILLFLIIYIPSLINWVYGDNIRVDRIKNGTIERSVNARCVIIRDEELLMSPFNGQYIPYVREGERAAAGSTVADIIKESSIKLLEEIRQKDANIIKEQNRKSLSMDVFSEDLKKIEDEISKKVASAVEDVSRNNMTNLSRYKAEINRLLEKKAEVIGGIVTSDSYIDTLKNDKQRILDQLNANTHSTAAEYPGTVSYLIDGYENLLTPEIIDELTPKLINEMKIKNIPQNDVSRNAFEGEPFAKMINGYDYYIAAEMDVNNEIVFKTGDVIRIRINDISKMVNGTVQHITEPEDGRYLIIAKTDRYLSETCGLRIIYADIIKSLHEGYKVPLKSLINVNTAENRAEIILVEANFSVIREVIIEGWNDEYAIIRGSDTNSVSYGESVALYDEFVVNPENVKGGQQISR